MVTDTTTTRTNDEIQDKICGMCGNIGYAEKLVTCSHCKKTSEHIYCMKDSLFEVPVLWYCEDCLQCLSGVHEGVKNASKKQKIFNCDSKFESIKGPVKRSLELNNKATAGLLPQCKKGAVDADAHGSYECIMTKQLVGNSFHPDYKFRKKVVQTLKVPLALHKDPSENLPSDHAPQACWKGTFEILETFKNSEVLSHFRGIQAHLPCGVSPKVDKISRELPENLKFKSLAREDVWPRIFQLDPPTKQDIGLYFLPSELGRNRKYNHILESLDSRDNALQACMRDAQLLIFSSNQLPLDSQRKHGEAYLWGVFCHLNQKEINRHTKVKCPHSSTTVRGSNNCDPLTVPFERKPVSILLHRENSKTYLPVSDIMTPPGFPRANLRNLKYFGNSIDKFPEKVTETIDPDIPPGFSKRPGFTELRGARRGIDCAELNVPPDRNYEEVDVLRDTEVGKPDVPIPSINTPPGFPEPHSRELNYVKNSFVKFPSTKVVNPSDPDIPPGFSKLPHPGFSKLLNSKHRDSSCETKVKGAMPSKKVDDPIDPDIPPGFFKLSPPGCSELLSSKRRQSSCEIKVRGAANPSRIDDTRCIPAVVVEGHSDKASPQKVVPKCHQAFDNWCKSVEPPGSSSLTCSAEEQKGFKSPDSSESGTKLHSTGKNLPSSCTMEKVCGTSENHSSWMRRISLESSPESVVVSSKKPLIKSGPHCLSVTRGNGCAKKNVPSKRNPEEVMNSDMAGDENIVRKDILIPRVDTPSGSLEFDIKIDMSGDTKFDRTDLHISGVDTLPALSEVDMEIDMSEDTKMDRKDISMPRVDNLRGSSEMDSGKNWDFIKFSLKKANTPVRPSIPLCFSKLGTPNRPMFVSSEAKISSLEDCSKGPSPSKVNRKDIASSPTGGSYAERVPKLRQVQSKCWKANDHSHKYAEHLSSSCHTGSMEEKKGFRSVASHFASSKCHSLSKDFSSLPVKDKAHGSSLNLSDERPATDNKLPVHSNYLPQERGKDFHEKSRDVAWTPERNTGVNSVGLDLESVSALKRELLSRLSSPKSAPKEDKIVEERETHRGISGVQESQMAVSGERIFDEAKGEDKTQNKNKKHSVNKKLFSKSGHNYTSGSHEPRLSSSRGTNRAQKSQRESQTVNVQRSMVSGFYSSASISGVPLISPAQRSTNRAQECKRNVFGEKIPSELELEGEGKMQSKDNERSGSGSQESHLSASQERRNTLQKSHSESNSWNTHKSFVSAFYGSPSIFHERPILVTQRGIHRVQESKRTASAELDHDSSALPKKM